MKNNEYVDFLIFAGLGVIEIKATESGLSSLVFTDKPPLNISSNYFTTDCKNQLIEYLNRDRRAFDLKLNMEGTDFQIKVWKEIQKIPFGHTRTYGEIATRIGMEKSNRAIGSASGCNKLSIIVPCHRVVGCDNKLKGYAYGVWRKEWLLKHEGCKDQLFSKTKMHFL